MGKRQCPMCFVRMPWCALLARSYEMECPACRTALELSRYTRVIAGFGGIAGGLIATHLADGVLPGASWAIRVLASTWGFGIVSAACVLLAGDLVVRPRAQATTFPHPAR